MKFHYWPRECYPKNIVGKRPYPFPFENTLLNSKNQISNAKAYLQPMSSHKCTLLLISNMAYPEWISIHCDKPILNTFVCVKTYNNTHAESHSKNQMIPGYCKRHTFRIENICFLLTWFDATDMTVFSNINKCKQKGMFLYQVDTLDAFKKFNFIYTAYSFVLFSILSIRNQTSDIGTKFQYKKFLFEEYFTENYITFID